MDRIDTPNRILRSVSPGDLDRILAIASRRRFVQGDTIFEPGAPITHLHFVEEGIISIVVELSDGRSVESYMAGFEGVAGVAAAVTPVRTFSRHACQVSGRSLQVEAEPFRAIVRESPRLREQLAAYEAGVQAELERSNACNVLHNGEQRLAKWLLRCHDRVAGDVMLLTQEYLAAMLGSQRTTVNEAAQALQAAGGIAYAPGKVTVTDRRRLERAACECYGPASILDMREAG